MTEDIFGKAEETTNELSIFSCLKNGGLSSLPTGKEKTSREDQEWCALGECHATDWLHVRLLLRGEWGWSQLNQSNTQKIQNQSNQRPKNRPTKEFLIIFDILKTLRILFLFLENPLSKKHVFCVDPKIYKPILEPPVWWLFEDKNYDEGTRAIMEARQPMGFVLVLRFLEDFYFGCLADVGAIKGLLEDVFFF